MEQNRFLKNIEFSQVIELASLVDYADGQVVSRTLAQGKPLSVTLFAFAEGEEISTHSSPGDAMVYILDGEAEVTIGEEKFTVHQGETIVMPNNIPHGLIARKRFKMLLLVVFRLT
jgi:quercetin dioxygenase-like cupin family protein